MLTIRNADKKDMHFILDLANQEGWLPGFYDSDIFFDSDNQGFFIAELEGKPISCISAVKYNEYAFIGFYVVKKEYRGHGFGYKIWNHAIDYLGDINIGLDGVLSEVESYKKSGFRVCHKNARYFGNISLNPIDDKNIIRTNKIDFDKLLKYDECHFGSPREVFLKKWINQPESYSYCYRERQEIKGFVVARKVENGYKIGPLFAKNLEIADSLFQKILSKIDGKDFYIDINEEFNLALKLISKYQLEKVFETMRMYTKFRPNALWDEVFGITSYELG